MAASGAAPAVAAMLEMPYRRQWIHPPENHLTIHRQLPVPHPDQWIPALRPIHATGLQANLDAACRQGCGVMPERLAGQGPSSCSDSFCLCPGKCWRWRRVACGALRCAPSAPYGPGIASQPCLQANTRADSSLGRVGNALPTLKKSVLYWALI